MIHIVKRSMTMIAGASAARPVIHWIERCGSGSEERLRVLTYHRIGYPEQTTGDGALFSATPEMFRSHLELLKSDYRIVSIEDVLQALDGSFQLPARSLLITFDDAYSDFAECAWPILRSLDIPATLFVPTAFPDSSERSFWWDKLCHGIRTTTQQHVALPQNVSYELGSSQQRELALGSIKRLVKSMPHLEAMQLVDEICDALQPAKKLSGQVLSWGQLKHLASEGVAIGLHTHTHPLLSRIRADELQTELVHAWEQLRLNVPDSLPIFAYPAGAATAAARNVLEEIGIRLAFTTQPGANDLQFDDPLLLRRIHVAISTTTNILRAKLATANVPWLS